MARKTVIELSSLSQDKENSRTPKGQKLDLDMVVINRETETRGLAADDRTRRVYYRKAWFSVPRFSRYKLPRNVFRWISRAFALG